MPEPAHSVTYVPRKDRLVVRFSLIGGLFAVAILGVLFTHTYILYESTRERAETEPQRLVQELGELVARELDATGEALALAQRNISPELVPNPMVEDLFTEVSEVRSARIYAPTGELAWERTFGAAPAALAAARVRDEPFFRNSIRGNTYAGVPEVVEEATVLEWSAPIMDGTSIVGVLHVYADLTLLVELLSAQEPRRVRIIDNERRVLVGASVEDLPIENRVADVAFRERDEAVTRYQAGDGVEVLGAWYLLEEQGWGLILEIPATEIYGDVYLSLRLLLVTVGIVILLLLVSGFYFNRIILAPIASIRDGIERFAKGEYGARVVTRTPSELGALGKTFNAMAELLAEEPNRLRSEVEKRTEELEAANTQLQLLVREVHENSQKILGKESALLEANKQLKELTEEMDRVGKILVRRDRELTVANVRLEELDRVKSEFVSVAAHQLRTPLTAIRWSLNSLANSEFGELSEDQEVAVRNGLSAAESAINLINDLLDTARIEGGRFGFEFGVAPLAPTLERAVKNLMARATHKGITLSWKPLPDNVCINHDPDRLIMSIENAIDNAIKYTAPPGKVDVAHSVTDDTLIIQVSDTGIGIPKDQQYRLFTKFFRAPNAMLMQTAGTGLGLYLMKNIVESHGGTVEVESEEGKGTTMIFTLPRVPCPRDETPNKKPRT